MGSLSIGTTIGAFPAVHTGMPIVRLGGNLTVNEQLFIGQGVESASDFYGDGNLVVRGSHSSTGKVMQIMNSSGNEAFTIFGSGDAYVNRYLGVNTSSPGRRLDVNGNARIRSHLRVNEGARIDTPNDGSPTMNLGRQSGNESIKSDDGWLIMDSGGTSVGLNYYSSDDIDLARGGGEVHVNNGMVVGGRNKSTATDLAVKDSDGGRMSLLEIGNAGVGIQYDDSTYNGMESVNFLPTDQNGAAESGWYANMANGGHLLLRGQQPSINIGSDTDNEGLNFKWHSSGRIMIHKSNQNGSTSGSSIMNMYTSGTFEATKFLANGGNGEMMELRGNRPRIFFNADGASTYMRIEARENGDLWFQRADSGGGYVQSLAKFDTGARTTTIYGGLGANGGINIGGDQSIHGEINAPGAMYYIEGSYGGSGVRNNVNGSWGYMWDHHNLVVSSSAPTSNLEDGMIWIET